MPPALADAGRDLRYALRLLGRERGFAAATAGVLALGLGIANMQFVLLDAICLRGLPIPRVERVLFIGARDAQRRDVAVSYREFEQIQAAVPDATVAAYAAAPAVIGDDDRAPDRALAVYVSAPLLQVLGERPRLGRVFETADDRPGAPPVAVLTAGVWQSRYGGNPDIVGRIVSINGTPTTIVGVTRGGFRFPGIADVWLPLSAMAGVTTERRTARVLSVAGRLHEGAASASVTAELATASNVLARTYPATNTGVALFTVPINERYSGRWTDSVWLAFAGVGIVVLLIACANAANLLMIRAARRGHEIAVRASLGASRGRIVRQLLVESAVLAALGASGGLVLAAVGLHLVNRIVPDNTLPYWITFVLDARALAAMAVMCAATVLAFGTAPALHVAKTDVAGALNAGGRGGTGSIRARRWTTVLLTAECGLTMVMLATLVLGLRSVRDQSRRFIAIDPTHVLTTWLTLPGDRYRTADQRRTFYRTLEEDLQSLPGASIAAAATALPLGGAAPRLLDVDGRVLGSAVEPRPTVWTVGVSPHYFNAMDIALIRGRAFDDQDGSVGHEAAIINERLAGMVFRDTDPIGAHLRLTDPTVPGSLAPPLTVVGVSPAIRQRPQAADPDPIVYLPLAAAPPASAVIFVRGPGDPASLAAPVREAVRSLDAELPLYRTMPMEAALDASQWNGRVSSLLLYVISLSAVVLATIGLYSVIAHAVEQRTREIGIRVALGARRSKLIAMVASRAAFHFALGGAAGAACVAGWERFVSSGGGEAATALRTTDPLTLAGAVALLAAITLVAALVPAWSATRIDPIVALRHE